MPGGRPPKPVETKRRLGNPGKRALPECSSLAIVPAVPKSAGMALSPLDAFERVIDAGAYWLAETDLPAITLLRELLEERGGLKAAIDAGVGDRKHLRDLDKQIITLLSQLGFDPAARSRLGLAEVKAASKLEELRARRQKRG